MKYYWLRNELFGVDWAWGDYKDDEMEIDYSPKTICPLCGKLIECVGYLPPYNIKLNKKNKVGTFIHSPFLMAEGQFFDSFQKAGLKGLEKAEPVNLYFRRQLLDKEYYRADVAYSLKKLEYAKVQKESRKTDKSLPRCELCTKSTYEMLKKYYFSNGEEFDVFTTYEDITKIYANQRFVDFCLENGFTNIVEDKRGV